MQPHLNRRQICTILNCTKTKFYSLIADKKDPLPAYKLGDGPRAEWRVDPEELKAWMQRHTAAATYPEPASPPSKRSTVESSKRWEMIIPEVS